MSLQSSPGLAEAAHEFLSHRRIAVAGASRSGDTAGNVIYRRLRDAGYEVFAVNPNAEEIEGDRCYPDLSSVPGEIDGVVIATHPKDSAAVVKDCAHAGVKRAWLHRSFGTGSVSESAIALAERTGIDLIPGACPMMFCEPVDVGHKCMKWVLGVMGKLPD